MTTAEVAELWGCTQQWVQILIKRKVLRAQLFGKVYLVNKADALKRRPKPVGRPPQNGHTKTAPRGRGKPKG